MKRHVVLMVLVIVILSAAFVMIGCSPSPASAPTAVPVIPILVTEDTPTPTPTPTVAPTPTVKPPLVACEPVVLAKVTDDTAKFKGLAELAKLGESRALPSGQRVFTVLLAGSTVVIAEMGTPLTVLVNRGSESSGASLVFTEKQVYSVRLACIKDNSLTKTEEVRFFFAGNEPYLYFP